MAKFLYGLRNALWLAVNLAIMNSWGFLRQRSGFVLLALGLFLGINLLAGAFDDTVPTRRMGFCNHGAICLWQFLLCILPSVLIQLSRPVRELGLGGWLMSVSFCVALHAVLFWIGMICVYLTSGQLAIKYRLWGLLLGLVPIANLVMLCLMLHVVTEELRFEKKKHALNKRRRKQRVCDTRYPILLVHGVFFRDDPKRNYWGRIPAELERNGARIFYGNHQSAASVPYSARELTDRVREILAQTGAEKVNIIAHSKGGLDCRYAIANLEMGQYVASLTTINTPHRGCEFADYLLEKIPQIIQNGVADTYDAVLKRLGDHDPGFMEAVTDLTATACREFDALPMPENVFCRSVGSVMEKASGGQFPLNFCYHLVNRFDGPNDGLVAESSFRWGPEYILLTTRGPRGISHGDVIDMNRENLPDFDVREFYVGLVRDLKDRGL